MTDTASTPATTVVTTTPLPVDAPKSSALANLADKRKKMRDGLHLDLKVPRWEDPEIFVRFNPIDATQTEAAIDKRRESNIPEWLVLANADILALACEGVYATLDGDHTTKYSLRLGDNDGKWTRFDPDLAAALGVTLPGATEVVRALYPTDGDLLNTAAVLTEWSSSTIEKADGDF